MGSSSLGREIGWVEESPVAWDIVQKTNPWYFDKKMCLHNGPLWRLCALWGAECHPSDCSGWRWGWGVGEQEECPVFSPVTGQCCNREPRSLGTGEYAGTGTGEAVPRVEVWGASPWLEHSLPVKKELLFRLSSEMGSSLRSLGVFLFRKWEGRLFIYPQIILLRFCKTDRPTNKPEMNCFSFVFNSNFCMEAELENA